jgi:hypothetical protein
MVKALKQLVCPQSAIHGWSGMVLSPMVYALLEPTPFVIPGNPGPVAVYTQFATPAMIKQINAVFLRLQKEHQSYENIRRACFRMLDTNVADQFKVSNIPSLIGWNASMSIIDILDQLDGTYGKPDMMTLLQNDKHFRSAFNPRMPPSHYSTGLNNAKRYRSSHMIHTRTRRSSTTPYGCRCKQTSSH